MALQSTAPDECEPPQLAEANALRLVCIQCGHPVDSLYEKARLKATECPECGQVTDKYIEMEPVVVMIDICLMNREAYRHVLYNTHFKNRFKINVIIVLLETILLRNVLFAQHDDMDPIYVPTEQLFYACFATCIVGRILVALLLLVLARFAAQSTDGITPTAVFKCLTLGSVTKFFLLPGIIWPQMDVLDGFGLYDVLSIAYSAMAFVQVFSVLCRCSRWKSSAMILLLVATMLALHEFSRSIVDNWLRTFSPEYYEM